MRVCYNITSKCNRNCRYCFKFEKKDLSLEDNVKVLQNLVKNGVSKISWTGGEPFLYDGLSKLLKMSKDYSIINSVNTNLTTVDAGNLKEKLENVDRLIVSLDFISDILNEEYGIGKDYYKHVSSILKLILGERIEYNGLFKTINELKISYVSQSTENLKGTVKEYAKETHVDEGIFRAMLSKMGISNIELEKDMNNMSEGQKKKILIARSISEQANLYVWDEPLNYIDILTREQIEEAILKYCPTLIFVEHDETFVENIATKIIHLEK